MITRRPGRLSRRGFLKSSVGAGLAASAFGAMPIPSSALGKDGHVAPSERITLGGIGIGNRGTYDLGCFLEQKDVQFLAVCDVKAARRDAVKKIADEKYGNKDCAQYRDFRDLLDRQDIDAVLIATGPNWHATAAMYAARAGKDMYCEKPCTKNIAQSLELADTMRRTGRVFQAGTQRRNLPHFAFACELARTGKLGKLKTVYAHPAGMTALMSGWLPAEPEPNKEVVDWDMYLGPAAWRPYNAKLLDGFNFEKGGGLVGGGVLEWGSHCVDLCQWANDADDTTPIEYEPTKESVVARYANGVKLVFGFLDTPFGDRPGWHNHLGTCPVRFEGDQGWVETGDSGGIEVHPASLRKDLNRMRTMRREAGTDAGSHGRNFFDCIKSRRLTNATYKVMRNSHVTSYAAAIAWMLDRKVTIDPKTETFVNDDQANRLRSRAMREPWIG